MVKRSTTQALKAARKPADSYEATRDRPESFDELVTFTISATSNIYRLIREMNSQIDAIKVNIKHTNKRLVDHENSGRHVIHDATRKQYAHEDQL